MIKNQILYNRSQKSEDRSQRTEDRGQMSGVGLFCIFSSIICLLLSVFCCLSSVAQEEVISVIKFKDADIKVVLQSIAQKAFKDGKKVNIVISPKVEGLVTVDLESVDWQTALKGVLNAYGYSYRWVGENIILVATIDEIKEREIQDKERQDVEVPKLKVFQLKYLDANDAKKAIQSLLSPAGKVSAVESMGQAGWEFGDDIAKRKRAESGQISRTKTLIVSDVSKSLEAIESLLKEIDVIPRQILIKTRIVEVDRNLLRDIGFDWGTGSSGAGATFTQDNLNAKNTKTLGGHMLGDQTTPTIYPSGTKITTSNTGFRFDFKSLAGNQFEVIAHALEDDVRANTLSAPSVLTLDNQTATILVGTKFPIVKTQVSEQSSEIIGGSLEKYQDIGIQLNVVPQICGKDNDFINMIIHPVVSSKTEEKEIKGAGGVVIASYPVLEIREAETQIIMKEGETIVIGGLLKDVKKKEQTGVPILKNIPGLGLIFRRDSFVTEKIDLLIFITAHIVKFDQTISPEMVDAKSFIPKFKKK